MYQTPPSPYFFGKLSPIILGFISNTHPYLREYSVRNSPPLLFYKSNLIVRIISELIVYQTPPSPYFFGTFPGNFIPLVISLQE